MHHLTIAITDLGDSAVTLPMAAVTIAILLVLRRIGMAAWWGGSIVVCAGVITVLKLLLIAAAPHHHSLSGLTSPSGHAAMSAAVYGGFVLLIGPSLPRAWRIVVQLGALALVLAIAMSRIVLHEHSIAETVVGLGVGFAVLAGLRAALSRGAAERVPVLVLCAAALAVIGVMHGTRLRTEPLIRALAHSGMVHELMPRHG
ncbi:MAG TPA: phosphatase PAP2 family protein [Stellaceae bacterium]